VSENSRVRYLPENKNGRDFVLGDLHGQCRSFEILLKHVKFDCSRDRVFCVGDLIDRGEDSRKALGYLNESWFFSVRGNHEDMLLDYWLPRDQQLYAFDPNEHDFLSNGGNLWYQPQGIDQKILENLKNLPLLLVVGKETPMRFHVVHAGLVSSTQETRPYISFFKDEDIDRGLPWDRTRYIVGYGRKGSVAESVLWDRTLPYALRDIRSGNEKREDVVGSVAGLSRTYVGHTPLKKPSLLANHYLVDTGSYQEDMLKGLTLTQVGTDFVWTANPDFRGSVWVQKFDSP